ncbi:hypothetical protein R5R35_000528 [Gryllus longicercus]|uniref:Carbonic anhydrase n=1 Tax=Gryllus longicercus TaxID=2509291 RepID=A0AAN9VU83_9ORTH
MALEYSDPSATPRTVVSSEGSSTTFLFRSLHFHWPSEHYINGKRYDLEMHMVHQSEDNRLLVLGYMFHVCRRASSGMEVVGASVNRLGSVGSTVPVSQFAPQRLMPGRLDQCGYFQYNGSLTTPPCTEGVTWLVREEPLCVEQWELDAFNNVTNAEGTRMAGNARDLQAINGRTITYHRCVFVRHGRFDWLKSITHTILSQ